MAADPPLLVARLAALPAYRERFARAFPGPRRAHLRQRHPRARGLRAHAGFAGLALRPLCARRARRALAGRKRSGLALFRSLNTRCFECHRLPTFDAPLALGVGVPSPDPGVAGVSGEPAERGLFGVPTLRNVARTAPYMHDGSLPTLAAVVDFYRRGGGRALGVAADRIDGQVRAFSIGDDEAAELVAFLGALERRIREPARARAGTVRAPDPPPGGEAMRRMLWFWLLLALAAPAAAENLRVRSGESIAAALELAKPGSVIEVEPGIYHEALVVDTPNITLRGIVRGPERPVLDGRGALNDGVIASGSPFTMTGFAVRHYKGNGVSTQGVDGVFLTDLVIDDTGLYGVYPVQSKNISVTHCTVTRIRDAAIYVGESQGALVAQNYVHHNVAGIEIENTNDAEVRDNLAHDNTAGILVFVLPGKVLKEGKRSRVHRNWVVKNNTPNFGDPESIVGKLPHGIGILLMGADDTLVENNEVRENASLGIAITRLAEEHAKKDPPLEPMTDGARVVSNHLDRTARRPHPSIAKGYGGGGDFGWDGTGTGNCADLADGAAPWARRSRPASMRDGAELRRRAACRARGGARGQARSPPPDLSGADAVVHIRGMRFEPRHVTVKPGQTVVWLNDDNVVHTITSGDGHAAEPCPLSSSFLTRGQTFRHTFGETGQVRVPVPAAPRPGRDARGDGDGGEVGPLSALGAGATTDARAEQERGGAEPTASPTGSRSSRWANSRVSSTQTVMPGRKPSALPSRKGAKRMPEMPSAQCAGANRNKHQPHHDAVRKPRSRACAVRRRSALGQARHDRVGPDPAREHEGEDARAGRARDTHRDRERRAARPGGGDHEHRAGHAEGLEARRRRAARAAVRRRPSR